VKRAAFASLLLSLFLAACASSPAPLPGITAPRPGEEFVACGRRFPAGTRVVLWGDPGGFDAYAAPRPFGVRGGESAGGWSLDALRGKVRQLVFHYDACGSSRRCFEVLQHERGLSCHFLLDVDGTVYQTLDLRERAWHAAFANDISVGIEIANLGAYADPSALPGQDLVSGSIHGQRVWQARFPEAQYVALERLVAALRVALPRIGADAPRAADGSVLAEAFPSEAAALAFSGLVGHFHLTRGKIDPGPAFAWERVVAAAGR